MSWSRRVRHSSFRPEWDRPHYEPSKRRLTWPNGAIATTYSADEPERLRGPQHDAAWCDEIASWRYPEAWDMLMFGLRLGDDPRVVRSGTVIGRTTGFLELFGTTGRVRQDGGAWEGRAKEEE